MSDEPRRWTISECGTIVSHDCDQRGCLRVGLREDRITDSDIEKVAQWLTERLGVEWINGGTAEARFDASVILSLVLGGAS